MNEMKIVAAMVVRRFRLTADAKRKPIIEPAVVLRAECVHLRRLPLLGAGTASISGSRRLAWDIKNYPIGIGEGFFALVGCVRASPPYRRTIAINGDGTIPKSSRLGALYALLATSAFHIWPTPSLARAQLRLRSNCAAYTRHLLGPNLDPSAVPATSCWHLAS